MYTVQQQVEKLFIELHYYYPFNRYIATISVFLWEVLRHILGSLGGNRLQVKINTNRYHQWYCMQMDNYSQSQPDFPMPTEYVSQSSHCSVELVHNMKTTKHLLLRDGLSELVGREKCKTIEKGFGWRIKCFHNSRLDPKWQKLRHVVWIFWAGYKKSNSRF